jgi:formamidase
MSTFKTPHKIPYCTRNSLHRLTNMAEGDGEISFCGAIEIAGIITIKFEVIKDGQKKLGMQGGRSPIYIPGPVQP